MNTNYIEELKDSEFLLEDLGDMFRVNGAREVKEIPTRKGIVNTYGIRSEVLLIFTAKHVTNFEDALTVLNHQYKIGYFDLDVTLATTVMIYLNEMSRRSEIKSFIIINLLNSGEFSIIDIPMVIDNLRANAIKQHTNAG